jgi:putative ABC transport system permease protein
LVRESIRTGMIPILNTMAIVGIVSLPGMMTGQILSGTDPSTAVAYQILILFMIASATSLTTMIITLGCVRMLRDPMHRLRWSRIRRRTS